MLVYMLSNNLISAILSEYCLPLNGIHGISHWARVLENGRRLAASVDAKLEVVELFSVFHDSRRENEGSDVGHGRRGADYAASMRGIVFDLPKDDFDLLYHACVFHTDGLTEGDLTVQVCWDADRLDLGRVGISPHRDYLCTDAAKDLKMIQWADARGRSRMKPRIVRDDWLLGQESEVRRR